MSGGVVVRRCKKYSLPVVTYVGVAQSFAENFNSAKSMLGVWHAGSAVEQCVATSVTQRPDWTVRLVSQHSQPFKIT